MALVLRSVNRIDWEELWRVICSNVWATLSSCLEAFLPASLRPYRLSTAEAAQLAALRARLQVQFDPDNPQHEEALQRLWGHAFPGAPWEGPRSQRWRDMGWQRDDPRSDFRGGGFASLQNHLFMAEAAPALFAALLHKSVGERSEWEYPFAVAGVNLTFALEELLELRGRRAGGAAAAVAGVPVPAGAPRGAAARGFVGLLQSSDTAFEEVYCCAFAALDAEWLARRAGYMEFNAVLKAATARVGEALAAAPASMKELQRLLGLPEPQPSRKS
ncbi:hypothetical protein WJX81_007341 [Elliptochloris bilobata]|uniref:ELMO domain-containing protein n=1 Tax=Elliptochloris bilobata TaxID=381761 RepID=A0AAW1SEH6_9CHLO